MDTSITMTDSEEIMTSYNDALETIAKQTAQEISEADMERIEYLLGNSPEIENDNSKLYIDPCIMSRLDEIDKELDKLRSMRKHEDAKKNLSKTREFYKSKLTEIIENFDEMQHINRKLDESMASKTNKSNSNDNIKMKQLEYKTDRK